jgi:hypothetical protein
MFSQIKSVLFTRIYTNLFSIFVFVLLGFLTYNYFKKPVQNDSSHIVNYLDSLNNQNKILLSRIDSLDLNKKYKILTYHTLTHKYDTLKIIIDSMPPMDATLFLLSKSRQLTSTGIE